MQQHAWLRVGLLLAMVSGAGVVYFGVLLALGFRPGHFKKGAAVH
jgi:putative peptidoglycan lipid II flippase